MKLLSNRRLIFSRPTKKNTITHLKRQPRFRGGTLELIQSLHGKFWVGVKMVQSRRHPLQQLTHAFGSYKHPFVFAPTLIPAWRPHEHLCCFRAGPRSAQERHQPRRHLHLKNATLVNGPTIDLYSRFHFYPIIPPVMYVVNAGVEARVGSDSSAVSPEASVLVCLTFLVFRFFAN